MDRSLFWFIIGFSFLLTSWLIFLCLSTCLGEPLRRLISHLWSRLLSYADSQPTPQRVRDWSSRKDGSQFNVPYTRLGGSRRMYMNPGNYGNQRGYDEYEDEVEMRDWRKNSAGYR